MWLFPKRRYKLSSFNDTGGVFVPASTQYFCAGQQSRQIALQRSRTISVSPGFLPGLAWHLKVAILAAAFLMKLAGVCFADHDVVPDPARRSTDQTLPDILDISPASVTVSGLSSGAFFAHQFHVGYSSRNLWRRHCCRWPIRLC